MRLLGKWQVNKKAPLLRELIYYLGVNKSYMIMY